MMDGLLQSIQNVTGCDRPEASQKAMGIDWDEVVYPTYLALLDEMTFEQLEYVGGLQYDPLALKYNKIIPQIIMSNQETFAGIIALCCAERSDIIQ